jgi:Cu-Zn family superoxide dismutase
MPRAIWLTLHFVLVSPLLVAAHAAAAQTAHAELRNQEGQNVGNVTLQETPHGVLITAELSGLPPGVHAFHIHEVGQCAPPFASAGGHFNPTKKKHGIEAAAGMHAGDLPNVFVPADGKLKFDAFATGVTLRKGPNSLFDADGSSLVLHAGSDDYESDPSGDAGARLACGVVTQ